MEAEFIKWCEENNRKTHGTQPATYWDNLNAYAEHLQQTVKELECVGFKMLSSIGNYMNDSRSGATYVFDYHSPSLDSGDLCSQPAWIDSETGDVLDPSEAFEIYRFEAQELLTKDKE